MGNDFKYFKCYNYGSVMSYVYSTGHFINYKHRKCLIKKTKTFLIAKISSIKDIAVNMFVNLRGVNHCYQERTQFSMHQRSPGYHWRPQTIDLRPQSTVLNGTCYYKIGHLKLLYSSFKTLETLGIIYANNLLKNIV